LTDFKPILERWVAPGPSTGSCSGKSKRRYRNAPLENSRVWIERYGAELYLDAVAAEKD